MDESPDSTFAHLKRLGVFQLKLLLDALRDLLLSPMSIVVTMLDIIEGKKEQDSHFNKLLSLGRKSERRINLFNQHNQDEQRDANFDDLVQRVESMVRNEYQEGKVTKKAKDTFISGLKRWGKSSETERSVSVKEGSVGSSEKTPDKRVK